MMNCMGVHNQSIEEKILTVTAYADREHIEISELYLSEQDYHQLTVELGTKIQYIDLNSDKGRAIKFKGVRNFVNILCKPN